MTLHAKLSTGLMLPFNMLDRMMPMHVILDAVGRLVHLGPTIAKMMGPGAAIGTALLNHIELRRPVGVVDFAALTPHSGARLTLALTVAPHLPLRGVMMALPQGGAILDISLGLSFARAVADFGLTLADFSPCDQTVDLLYLHEANTSTARLSRHLSERLHAAHASAQFEARTDVLTGLSNRRAIDDELSILLSANQHDFSLMHLDLDLFKHVNDTHGHAAGDAVLIAVGRILGRDLRRNDFPARVGGDEFLVILRPSLAPSVAGRIATRLIGRIEKPIRFEDVWCQISASIGIVSTKQYARRPSVERMLADADTALYRAKKDGRGRFALFGGGKPIMEDAPEGTERRKAGRRAR